ncbi:MAG: hypothetical protein JSW34_01730 [Candidatus Zixiibacteriota bacterium]|nr:MAG: hypothetical protein JSW34_01730 [candidate division Zixibacteria bacterium]
MKYCTVINCMDGRTQSVVNEYLKERFKVEFVDTITEPGPNRILAERSQPVLVESIMSRLEISLREHQSVGVAVVGHHDCAGNPAAEDEQIRHIKHAVRFIRTRHEGVNVIGLWVNERWEVEEV